MATMKRRDFLGTAGAGLLLGAAAGAKAGNKADATTPADTINLAVIGVGSQGRNLIDAAAPIPKILFRAVCDIWPYRQQYAVNRLKSYDQSAQAYTDYREMLDKEKNLDAILIATPDFTHAEQIKTCLGAGLHVYCETMMAHSIEAGRSVVRAAKQTSRLVQVGYQRRSHPCYRHVVDKLLGKAELPDQVTQVQTRWVIGASEAKGWPRRHTLPEDLLRRFGYDNMHEFRNWPWFREFGAGLAAGLMAHQLDVVNWFLAALPNSALAAGGVDFYKSRETPDNLTAVYQYPTAWGTVRACGQVLTSTRADGIGHFEQFCGIEGTIRISENPKWTAIFQDPNSVEWDEWVREGYLVKTRTEPVKPPTSGEQVVRETCQVEPYALPSLLTKPPLQLHLENFFYAIRGKADLHCPAEAAFRSEVPILKAIEAVETRRAIDLSPEDFAT